jgi:hypothetical protein
MEASNPRSAALLSAVSDEPTSTSALYDQVGYSALVRIGLIPYAAFRAELALLEKQGLVVSAEGEDGSTLWRRPPAPAEEPA